ncbi:hypothetical protein Cgig2_001130 [Carnegiea gigantea]|uniref:Uncharacterized protein n=1 Tax=Carnegiea gigantea TaxID=171969 RepID=A0A9Q1JRW5_9CARY|nr:hypothetical protein Cgig2_001130 [Carnegiea gigantea]
MKPPDRNPTSSFAPPVLPPPPHSLLVVDRSRSYIFETINSITDLLHLATPYSHHEPSVLPSDYFQIFGTLLQSYQKPCSTYVFLPRSVGSSSFRYGDHPYPQSQKMGPSYAQATKFGVGSSYQPQHSTDPNGVYPSLSSPDHVTDPQLSNPTSSPSFLPPVYEPASKDPTHEPEPDIPILAHSIHMLNPDHLTNTVPLNAMDEDLIEDSKDNDYEDSQEFMLDEEEMGDTFLILDTIQELELSVDSSKRRRVEEGEEGLSKATN